jgi:hypothetical protein
VVVRFGLKNMTLAPAGVDKPGTGHHHLLIDAPLPPKIDFFRAVMGHQRKATGGQHGLNDALLPRRELDELESVEAKWVVEQVAHRALSQSGEFQIP